jgi:phage terminase small subunit
MNLKFGEKFLGKRLTLKQYRFVKNYISGGLNATKATILSGYNVSSYDSAKSIGYQNIRKLHLREAIVSELDEQGLTIENLVALLKAIIRSGAGVQATNSDSVKGLELVERLRGTI